MAKALTSSFQTVSPAQSLGLGAYDDDQVTSIAVKAFVRVTEAWGLKNDAAAALLDVSPRTWARMKKAKGTNRLSQDQMMRVSGITGLYKALHLYFSAALADRWVTLENTGPSFQGHSPMEIMLTGGLPAILRVREYVDALRGGM